VYYTVDGTDPREIGTGNPVGIQYTDAVSVTRTVRIKARTKSGTVWSALTEADFIIDTPLPLRVTEIMYHPAPPSAGNVYDDEDFEFIELCNVGTEPVNPLGVAFTDGISYDFGPVSPNIGINECVILVRNLSAFATRYSTNGIVIAGEYGGKLDNAGELLAVQDILDTRIQGFSYSDSWYPSTDGGGYSLVIVDPYGETNVWDQSTGWRPSGVVHGTPGTLDEIPEPGTGMIVVIMTVTAGIIRRIYGSNI
jgi:hypothetical protein